jgi:hypothetical protein
VVRNNSIQSCAGTFRGLADFDSAFFLSRSALIAENQFLRKQLGLLNECNAKPRRTTPLFRLCLGEIVRLARW